MPAYRGVAVRALVNGREAGLIGWEPNEVDLTDLLTPGGAKNLLQIEVVGHRRNSHGPLHLRERWPGWTGPQEFLRGKERGYRLAPCGLLAAPVISVRRTSGSR